MIDEKLVEKIARYNLYQLKKLSKEIHNQLNHEPCACIPEKDFKQVAKWHITKIKKLVEAVKGYLSERDNPVPDLVLKAYRIEQMRKVLKNHEISND